MIALALAALAASAPVPEYTDAITYADGRVLYAEHAYPGKPLVVRESPLAGGPARLVASIPRAGDPREDLEVSLAANAGGYLIAIRAPGSDRVILGGYDGSLRTVVECSPKAGNGLRLQAAAGTSGFAFGGSRCDPEVGVVGAEGTLTPVPGIHSEWGPSLAYAEPYLAVTDNKTVNLIDVTSGARRALDHQAFGTGIGVTVQPDGTVFSGDDGIHAWPLGAAQPHRILRRKDVFRVFAGGGRVFFESIRLPLGLTSDSRDVEIGAPGAGKVFAPLTFDGKHAAFHSQSCHGEYQVTVVDVDAPRTGVVNGCPVRVAQRTLRFGRRWRTTIGVVCPNGCGGELMLTRNDDIVASGRLRLRPSRSVQRVRMRLDERINGRVKVYLGELNGLKVTGPRFVKLSSQP